MPLLGRAHHRRISEMTPEELPESASLYQKLWHAPRPILNTNPGPHESPDFQAPVHIMSWQLWSASVQVAIFFTYKCLVWLLLPRPVK